MTKLIEFSCDEVDMSNPSFVSFLKHHPDLVNPSIEYYLDAVDFADTSDSPELAHLDVLGEALNDILHELFDKNVRDSNVLA